MGSVSGQRAVGGQRRAVSALSSPVVADSDAASGGDCFQRMGRAAAAAGGMGRVSLSAASCVAAGGGVWRGGVRARPVRWSRRRTFRTCRGQSPWCRTCSGHSSASSRPRRRAKRHCWRRSSACQALAGEPVTLAATLAIAAAYVVCASIADWTSVCDCDVGPLGNDGRRSSRGNSVRSARGGQPRVGPRPDADAMTSGRFIR